MKRDFKSALAERLERELRPLVSRQGVYVATGYSPGYLANLDSCSNSGIRGRIRIGKKIFYPREEVIKWISARTIVEDKISL